MLTVLAADATRDTGAPAEVHVHVGAQPAAPAPVQAPASTDSIEQIARLAELHRTGALSDAEFTAAKAKVLGL